MRRFLIAPVMVIAVLCSVAIRPVAAQSAPAEALSAAIAAAENKDWARAQALAGAKGTVAGDLVEWMRLRARAQDQTGTTGAQPVAPYDVLEFLHRRSNWPGLSLLRQRAEPVMAGATSGHILAFYAGDAPKTATGALSLARAYRTVDQPKEATRVAQDAWLRLPMNSNTRETFLREFGRDLTALHATRLSNLLWAGHTQSATAMLPLVSKGQAALGRARIALQKTEKGVDSFINAVPSTLQEDAGLAYDRFVWRDAKRRQDDAIALMQARSTSAKALGEPGKWLRRRRDFARQLMRDGKNRAAYTLAADHHASPDDGYGYADCEWLAGYIALRKLGDPERATYHFTRFLGAVESPISLGRAGYWLGRSYSEQGEVDKAHAAYALGAKFQTSYYGLLAAQKLGRPFEGALATPPEATWEGAPFLKDSVTAAGLLLLKTGEPALAEQFLTHLVETLPVDQAQALGRMALDLNEPHLAVMISKRAAQRGFQLEGAYYPLHPVAERDLPMAQEMTLAIARRESEFDPGVVSHAGARGLMQVMPATADLVAREIGISGQHRTALLTTDWQHNARLGANYLAMLSQEFNGNVVLMAAGYNAGPHRPEAWMKRYGDPRTPAVDVVDWVEHIPFNETRNYVMRVTESLPIYRARLGKAPLPQPFSKELAGQSLKGFAP